MTTSNTPRRRRAGRRLGRARPRRSLHEIGELRHVRSWADVTMSTQLPTNLLAAGTLPPLVVGDVRDLVPAVYLSEYSPVLDVGEYYSDCDPEGDWWCSEAGTLCARGALVPPVPGNPGLQTFLLDVAGRAFPLNWTNPEPFLAPAIEATGGLYLDPRLDTGGVLAPTGDWCRAPLRVSAVRSYELIGGEPRDPSPLDRVPDPWEVQEGRAYVVDLVDTR